MNLPLDRCVCARCPRLALLVLVLCLVFHIPSSTLRAGDRHLPGRISTPAPAVVASGWSLGRLWALLESALCDRRRMIQLAMLGMCIGLYIMLRR